MLTLRHYQQRSLDHLETYLTLATQRGAGAAFSDLVNRPYRPVAQLPGLPYVCLRLPTGGGKTLMACHALGLAARRFLCAEHALCLWLVPTNTIREQTLKALRDRQHPYRQAVDAQFGGQVEVMDLAEALSVSRSSLQGATVIIVSTLAALRVEDTEGRKVYEQSGALQHHFSGLTPQQQAQLERDENGYAPCSLANVLRLWRPVVIVDEAHNARTKLSFDTLAHVNPSCIIEFTATPETTHAPDKGKFASNLLCHVSAAELKAEQMVKLPIRLWTQDNWRGVIGDALAKQRELEETARQEELVTGEYLRPLVLFQAQPKNQELTVEAIKKSLLEDFRVPPEHVAIATGETREIEGVDLFDRACPLRFLITVRALKEGWDCSFAYVLCSLADSRSARDVEQILGRVLRLPRASRKRSPDLNCAYAYLASPHFLAAAETLKDALVENGFERFETEKLVTPGDDRGSFFEEGTLFFEGAESVSEEPDFTYLPASLRDRVSYDPGSGQISYRGGLSQEDQAALESCFRETESRQAVAGLFARGRGCRPSPSPRTERPSFRVPALSIRVQGELEVLEEEHFLDDDWKLSDCDATLSEAEFPSEQATSLAAELDVTELGSIEMLHVQQTREQLSALVEEPGWAVPGFAAWLDKRIPHPDLIWAQSAPFIQRVIQGLMEARGVSVEQLARRKYPLRDAIERKIAGHREDYRRKSLQALFTLPRRAQLEVSPALCFACSEEEYAPNFVYQGTLYRFAKHCFSQVGELDSEGEEFECARYLDMHPHVASWVRNLPRRDTSFHLHTGRQRFYPDFVAKLDDGRVLVVEYKGAHLWSSDESKDKRMIGQLWAELSQGQCLFVMPQRKEWGAIDACIGGC